MPWQGVTVSGHYAELDYCYAPLSGYASFRRVLMPNGMYSGQVLMLAVIRNTTPSPAAIQNHPPRTAPTTIPATPRIALIIRSAFPIFFAMVASSISILPTYNRYAVRSVTQSPIASHFPEKNSVGNRDSAPRQRYHATALPLFQQPADDFSRGSQRRCNFLMGSLQWL